MVDNSEETYGLRRLSEVPSTENEHLSAITHPSKHQETIRYSPLNNQQNDQAGPGIQVKSKWVAYNSVVIISVVLPLIALIVWLAITRAGDRVFMSFSGEAIGGSLTQSQAKAIDVGCSAVLAPCMMEALNYFWFACARVCVVNERHPSQRGIPLSTLVVASTATGGSYDIFNLKKLVQGRTWRLILLATLILLSAIAKSAVSNLIAYEAYSANASAGNVGTLRYLAASSIPPAKLLTVPSDFLGTDVFGYGIQQQSTVANEITGLLTGLIFANASSKLANGAYIGINSTTASLNALPASVVGLYNAPGYRLTVDCNTDQPDQIGITAMGGYATIINTISSKTNIGLTNAYYPGQPSDIQGAYNDMYQFAAFSFNTTEVYLGFLTSFNYSGATIKSNYGTIPTTAQDMTSLGFTSTKSVMSYWGIRCWIDRQDGLLNYTRTSTQGWSLSASEFSNDRYRVPSFLAQWQTNLNYHAPRSTIPGIGPALALTAGNTQCSTKGDGSNGCDDGTDFEVLARNYLYASAEALRIGYEVAAANTSQATGLQDPFFYNVGGTVSKLHYRITYVPAILVIALVALIAAAATTVAMAAYGTRTRSARTFRKVDALRLVVDAVDGLNDDRKAVRDVAGLSGEGIEKWAEDCRVVYEKVVEDGQARIRLCRVDGAGGVKYD